MPPGSATASRRPRGGFLKQPGSASVYVPDQFAGAVLDIATPPHIDGVTHREVEARGVRFHVAEAGAGEPVVLLHGWPQHFFAYRELLAAPPAGLRLIAPDLPGYGWSGPPPHRWLKEEVATDVLALLDALRVERSGLVGHDWGGWIGYLLALRAPERFSAFLPLNIAHPWNGPRATFPHVWRFACYQPLMAAFGVPLHRWTNVQRLVMRRGLKGRQALTTLEMAWFVERFRDPVCARAARDTYRTFLLREVPRLVRRPEGRRLTVKTRALFGTGDFAIHHSLADESTALADDYRLERVAGCAHFIVDERPELVRQRVVDLFAPPAAHVA